MKFKNHDKRVQMAHVTNLISMSRIDGQLTQKEYDFILEIANEFNLTQTELDNCMKESDNLVIRVPHSEKEKIEYMKNLVTMTISEGVIDKQKRSLAEQIFERFGYNGKETFDIIYDELLKEANEEEEYEEEEDEEYEEEEEKEEPDRIDETSDEFEKRKIKILRDLLEDMKKCADCFIKNDMSGAFNYLLSPAFNKLEVARKMFLRIPNYVYPMFLLTGEQVDELKKYSDKGFDIAQYTLGRYYQLVRPNRENLRKARELFEAAAAQGLGDAYCGLALLARDGYYEEADPDKYLELISEAVDKNSQKARYFLVKDIIYGLNGAQPDPQKIIDLMTKELKEATGEAKEDIFKFEPDDFDLLGRAYQETGQRDKAEEAYIKAVSMGYFEALSHLATMNCCDEEGNIVAKEILDQYLKIGIGNNDAWSFAMRGHLGKEGYDDLSPNEQAQRTAEIKADLVKACRLGDNNAPAYLGEHYYYGTHGFEEDDEAAWKWFNIGSAYCSSECYGMMAQMISDGHCPKKVSEKFYAFCLLCAYRFGDESKLEDVIKAYSDGLLDDFKNEIERHYIPKYNDIAPAGGQSDDFASGDSCLDDIADMEISDPWS